MTGRQAPWLVMGMPLLTMACTSRRVELSAGPAPHCRLGTTDMEIVHEVLEALVLGSGVCSDLG